MDIMSMADDFASMKSHKLMKESNEQSKKFTNKFIRKIKKLGFKEKFDKELAILHSAGDSDEEGLVKALFLVAKNLKETEEGKDISTEIYRVLYGDLGQK